MKIFKRLSSLSIWLIPLVALLMVAPVSARSLHEDGAQNTAAPTAEAATSTPVPPTAVPPTPTRGVTVFPTTAPKDPPSPAPTDDGGSPTDRPILVVKKYKIVPEIPKIGQDFKIKITVRNEGTAEARNVILTFDASTFLPRQTGGVLAKDNIYQHNAGNFVQTFNVSSNARSGANLLTAAISYTDADGNAYSTNYTFTINVKSNWSGVARATKTPVPSNKSQLLITSYSTESKIEHLRPGDIFTLKLQVANMGGQEARNVKMAIGGATASSSGQTSDDGSGGDTSVSLSGGDFSHFAPIGASNVQTLGTIPAGENKDASQKLIVGLGTTAGAYSMKISFVYQDKDNKTHIDDQVITLLVYEPANLEISYYESLNMVMVNQPGKIPVQVVNLGNKSVVLGKIHVVSDDGSGSWEKNEATIGAVGGGDFYSLDAVFTPDHAGPQKIKVIVEYTDAFNNPQTIEEKLDLNVQDMPKQPAMEEGQDEFSPEMQQPTQPLSLWDRVVQFFSGLLGFDSGNSDAVKDVQITK